MSELDPILLQIDGDSSSADESLAAMEEVLAGLDESLAMLAESMSAVAEMASVFAEAFAAASESLAAVAEASVSASDGLSAVAGTAGEADGSLAALGTSATDASAGLDAAAAAADAESIAVTDVATANDAAATAIEANTVATDTNAASTTANADTNTVAADAKDKNAISTKSLNMALIGSGVVIALTGLAAVKMAGDFEASMETLVTGAGEAQSNIKMVGDGISQVSVDTGTSTKKLIDAMFIIESSGKHGQAALDELRAAAEGAKVGAADLVSETDVLTTSMHNYNMSSDQAIPVINSFISAVKNGKMHMDDLNQALTGVLPTASKAGIALTDVEGAIATMAASGDKGAAAGTHLSQMFQSLQNPTSKAKKMLEEIGLTTQDLADSMKVSFPATLDTIYQALAKKFPEGSAAFSAAAADIVGGNKQVKAWNELTGVSFQDLVNNTNAISDAFHHSGGAVADWDKVQKEFNQKMDVAGQQIEKLFRDLGTNLLPVLGQVADAFSTKLVPGIRDAATWMSNNHDAVVILAGVLGGVMLAAITALLIPIGAMVIAAAPLVLTFAGIGMAAALIVTHWPQLTAAWNNASTPLGTLHTALAPIFDAFKQLGTAILPTLKTVWDNLTTAFKNMQPFIDDIGKNLKDMMPLWNLLGTIIGGTIVGEIAIMVGIWNGLAGALTGIMTIVDGVTTVLSGFVQLIADLFSGKWGKIGDDIKKIFGGFGEIIKGAFETIKGFIGGFLGGVGTFFKNMGVDIGKHLHEAWTAIQDKAAEIWNDIAQFFIGVWDGIKEKLSEAWAAIEMLAHQAWGHVTQFFSDLWEGIKTKLAEAWKKIQDTISGAFEGIKTLVHNFVQGIVDFFVWLYNHNYYFKDLVDAIHNAFTWIHDKAIEIWNDITTWLKNAWKTIQDDAKIAWDWVKLHIITPIQDAWAKIVEIGGNIATWLKKTWKTIQDDTKIAWDWVKLHIITPIQDAWAKVTDIGAKIMKALSDAWDTVKKDAAAAWDNFIGAITGAWTKITTAIATNVVKPITDAIGNLASTAKKWGSDMIQGFIDGIGSMASGVKKAAGDIAGNIGGFLGFHHSIFTPPVEGPASSADKWMPALGLGLAEGLDAQSVKLKASAHRMAASLLPLGATAGMPHSSAMSTTGTDPAVALLAQILYALQHTGQGGTNSSTANTYNTTVNGGQSSSVLYRQMNQLAGLSAEYASRGASAGLGV